MSGALQQALIETYTTIGTPVSLGASQPLTGAQSSVTLTTSAAIPAHTLVVVGVVTAFSAAQTVTGVSDGTNTYAQAVTAAWDASGDFVIDIWYKKDAAAVSTSASLTATFSSTSVVGSVNGPVISAAYVANVQLASPLDKTNSGKQEPGTAYASGTTGTLSQYKEIAFGFVGGFSNITSVTEGSGFTQINEFIQGGGNNWGAHLAYKNVLVTTALNYQPTLSSSFGAALIATFKGL